MRMGVTGAVGLPGRHEIARLGEPGPGRDTPAPGRAPERLAGPGAAAQATAGAGALWGKS